MVIQQKVPILLGTLSVERDWLGNAMNVLCFSVFSLIRAD